MVRDLPLVWFFLSTLRKITGTEDAEGESSGEQASRMSKEEKLPDDSGSGMSPWGFFLYVKDAFLFMFS